VNLEKIRVYGSSSIGVFLYASDILALAPPDVHAKVIRAIKENLQVHVIPCKIYDSNLIGIFATGNSNGIALPYCASDEEINAIKKALREALNRDLIVERLQSKMTALGNLVLANDRFAIASPLLNRKAVRALEDILNVEVEVKEVAGSPLVGAIAVATNKGLLVHPVATDEEVEELGRLFKVNANVGTVNRGSPYIRAGLIINDKGALVGEDTTGPELLRIQSVFF